MHRKRSWERRTLLSGVQVVAHWGVHPKRESFAPIVWNNGCGQDAVGLASVRVHDESDFGRSSARQTIRNIPASPGSAVPEEQPQPPPVPPSVFAPPSVQVTPSPL